MATMSGFLRSRTTGSHMSVRFKMGWNMPALMTSLRLRVVEGTGRGSVTGSGGVALESMVEGNDL